MSATNPSEAAFTPAAAGYDTVFSHTELGDMLRRLVWARSRPFIRLTDRVLEVNCGTGLDAAWLSGITQQVCATDLSAGMLSQAQSNNPSGKVSFALAHAAQLPEALQQTDWPAEGYDLIWSNFGGLNCLSPDELAQFAHDSAGLLRPNGRIILVVMGRFCAWETLYFLLKGRWQAARRRWRGGPVMANLDGVSAVETWYHSPTDLRTLFPNFHQLTLEPIGVVLPPTYLEPFFRRFPRFLRWLGQCERVLRWRGLAFAADHYLMVLGRR
jgi:SAM-dependent methyltransferase